MAADFKQLFEGVDNWSAFAGLGERRGSLPPLNRQPSLRPQAGLLCGRHLGHGRAAQIDPTRCSRWARRLGQSCGIRTSCQVRVRVGAHRPFWAQPLEAIQRAVIVALALGFRAQFEGLCEVLEGVPCLLTEEVTKAVGDGVPEGKPMASGLLTKVDESKHGSDLDLQRGQLRLIRVILPQWVHLVLLRSARRAISST